MQRFCAFLMLLSAFLLAFFPAAAQDGERPPITPENADQVKQLAILGPGMIDTFGVLAWSPDGQTIAGARAELRDALCDGRFAVNEQS